jgi:membrane fusion protein (multidrug efflux system)
VASRVDQTTDDAYVRGNFTPISAMVEGYVRSVAVKDFQKVKAGDLLVQIDDAKYRAQVKKAEADVLAAKAAVANLKAQKDLQNAMIVEARSTIAGTEADVERTKLEAGRQRALLASTYGTQQNVEKADADAKRYQATLAQNHAQLEAEKREIAVLNAQEIGLQAQVKQKQALLDLATIDLGYTRIVAPVDGMVGERGVRVGQYVQAGTQIIPIVPLHGVWVVANYKETQLTRVAVGQKARIRIDSFPGTVITGQVVGISPASGSLFSLLPPDNATGNFTKVVQRIPVKIAINTNRPLAGRLRAGMSAVVTIMTDTTDGSVIDGRHARP